MHRAILLVLAVVPVALEGQDLTACFPVELFRHQEDAEVVVLDYMFRNACSEPLGVHYYQRFFDPETQGPGMYNDGHLTVLPGDSAFTRVHWRKAEEPFPPPVLAWCGWRSHEEDGNQRCFFDNDYMRGSKANWRVRERP